MTDGHPPARTPRWRTYIYSVRRFLRNRYFWSGLAVLMVIGTGAYLLLDRVIMPSVTRYGVSVTVPDVTGLTPEEADSALALAGLSMQQQLLRKLNLPRNQVIDQRPPGGREVKPGRAIYVTVNTGDTTTVAVPDLLGRSRHDADGRLGEFGLRAGKVTADSVLSTRPRDTITRQDPEFGERVPKGTLVRIWYSMGPSAEFVRVPEVSGLAIGEAIARLRAVDLNSVVLGPSDGIVRDHGPPAGTVVRVGSEIRLRTRPPQEGNQ